MGKVEPKVSWALSRAMEVRRALGVKSSWAKGHRGAQRVARLLAARTVGAAADNRMPPWDRVPEHVQEDVLDHVSLIDLHNLRLAGFGGRDIAWREHLRRLFIRRRERLRDVLDCFAAADRTHFYRFPNAESAFKPDQFAALTKVALFIDVRRNDTEEDRDRHEHLSDDEQPTVPDGICEMRALKFLAIASDGFSPKIPRSLTLCAALHTLTLSDVGYKSIPAVVLELSTLRVLNFSRCRVLEELPESIGDRLVNLTKVEIRECNKLRTLPESLLRRLELSKVKMPLPLRRSVLEPEYLNGAITEALYPRLRASLMLQCGNSAMSLH